MGMVSSAMRAEQACQGWQIEQCDDGVIAQHFHSHRCVQTIQITNHGNIYFLIAGPYGFDQIALNGTLPKKFPRWYQGKCCWLRRTKDGKRLIMTYHAKEPEDILRWNG